MMSIFFFFIRIQHTQTLPEAVKISRKKHKRNPELKGRFVINQVRSNKTHLIFMQKLTKLREHIYLFLQILCIFGLTKAVPNLA